MSALERFPAAQPVPPAAISRVLSRFDRPALEGFISVALDLLDLADGDADIEPNGDEVDGSMGEDDFCSHAEGGMSGIGCPLSDPGEEDDPSGQCDEDGINTMKPYVSAISRGAGCKISDPDAEHDGREPGY